VNKIETLNLLSLFSGIGAFEMALNNLNIDFELLNYCEIDKFASKSYSLIHNVSEELNLGDITQIDIENLPSNIDIITHGSPCQSFSISGLQHGGNEGSGTRSSLMWNTVEIIRQHFP
jgi:DNA (cytosine-5)-methyltransferase 1